MEEDIVEITNVEATETDYIANIVVVRHAESVANTKGIYQGQTYDTNLSKLGKKQAKALAERASQMGVKKIIASPLRRTYQTALEIASLADCEIEVNNLLIETNHGDWEGKDKEWITQKYPDVIETWYSSPSRVIFPGGEAFIETYERVTQFLDGFQLEDRTLIVTHDNIVRIMVTLANGWTLDEIWTHDIEPAALNFFEVGIVAGKNKLNILKLNDNIHLEGIYSNLSVHAL
jgi:phosphoserine phosphatase